MRHRKLRRKLGVKSQHRQALLRNLVRGLVEHKRIRTTHAKAKEASAFADKLVTIAKRGDLSARRLLVSRLGCDDTAKVLVNDIAPHFKERNGGYTRVLRLTPRPGDQSEMALLEFSVMLQPPKEEVETKKKSKASKKPKVAAKPKQDSTKKDSKAEEASQEETQQESEKKGGFLGSLRKFLKGDE